MRNRLFLTLILTALICLVGWTAHASLQTKTAVIQNWEYMTLTLEEASLKHPHFNHYGAQGWELVAVLASCPTGSANCASIAYFKRPTK